MDILGIKRLGLLSPGKGPDSVQRNHDSSPDRDAHRGPGYEKREKPTQLSTEQENDAIQKLNALPSFSQAGLKAELLRKEGHAPHAIVRDQKDQIIRRLSYEQLIDLYLERNLESDTGRLLRKAA